MMPATIVSSARDSRPRVILCAHCAAQRLAACALAGGVGLEIERDVTCEAGCCHDCGGGFCNCRGVLRCELCPRANSPVIVTELFVYRVLVPRPPSTIPSPIGGG